MHTFVVAKRYLKFGGIIPFPRELLPVSVQNYQNAIIRVHIGIILIILLFATASSIFAMQLDNEDAPVAMFYGLNIAFCTSLYLIFIWNGSKLVDLMDASNKLIENRESK